MICFPIMHKQTERKIIRMSYSVDTKYGVMAELLFSCGYRIGDIIKLKKCHIFNGSNATLHIKEGKTNIRRFFEGSDIPDSLKEHIKNIGYSDYVFQSNRKLENGKKNHISRSRVKQVFHEIFSSIPKLRGAYGTHIFRKTFAYNKYKKGDIYTAKKALGHININSTIKYIPEEIIRCWGNIE